MVWTAANNKLTTHTLSFSSRNYSSEITSHEIQQWNHNELDGGCSSMVTESEFKSEEPVFDPLMVQREAVFLTSESTLVQSILCLTPLRVHSMHPNLCARETSHIHLS